MVKSHPKWECFLHWAYPVYHFACLNHVKSHQYPSFDAKKIPFTPHFSCWNSIFWSWIFPLLRSPGLQKRPVTGFTILHRLRVCILQALQLFLQLRRASRCGTPVISRGDDWGSPIEKAHRFNMLPKKNDFMTLSGWFWSCALLFVCLSSKISTPSPCLRIYPTMIACIQLEHHFRLPTAWNHEQKRVMNLSWKRLQLTTVRSVCLYWKG